MTLPPGLFSISTMKNSGFSGSFVLIIKISPDSGTSVKGISVSPREIKTFEPVNGAKPPKSPVPASHSIEKKDPRSAAGAIVTDGTRLMILPFSFSTLIKI